jgi:hypothetical protein
MSPRASNIARSVRTPRQRIEVPQQENLALTRKRRGVGHAPDDLVSRQDGEQLVEVDPLGPHGRVDVVGQACHAAQDHCRAPDQHVRLADREQGGAKRCHGSQQRILQGAHRRARRRRRAQRS